VVGWLVGWSVGLNLTVNKLFSKVGFSLIFLKIELNKLNLLKC
jgi:hypothetical protein